MTSEDPHWDITQTGPQLQSKTTKTVIIEEKLNFQQEPLKRKRTATRSLHHMLADIAGYKKNQYQSFWSSKPHS